MRIPGATVRRAAHIANVLFREGFEFFVDQTPLRTLVTKECRRGVEQACRCPEGPELCPCGHARPLPQRVLSAVIELGPTFIKIGQIASTRPDLVPPEFSEPLRSLQENVPAVPFKDVRDVVESELGRPLDEAFASFQENPIASASLSQVHFASLQDGTEVAVKVQRPGIRATIEGDLAILRWLARQLARLNLGMRNLRPEAAVDEFGQWTLRELDFSVEGRNYDEFRRNFADRQDVHFPHVYWAVTTERCLTMERVSGLRVHQVASEFSPLERERIARRLAEIELQMLVTDAFFHADLHPGNVFFRVDGTIVIIDVGMVGRIGKELQDRFLCYWIAIERRQRDRAFHHLLKMATSTTGADLDAFRSQFGTILDRFYGAALSERSLARTYLDIVLAGSRSGVVFPSEMVLQAKAVVTAEALDLVLHPEFKFTEEARPIIARELARRASPEAILDRVWSGFAEFILLGEPPPAGAAPSSDDAEEARFRREAIKALAHTWSGDLDGALRNLEGRMDEFASADFWRERPELHSALETGLGLLRLIAVQLDRVRLDSVFLREPHTPQSTAETVDPAGLMSDEERRSRERFAAFRSQFNDLPQQPWTEELIRILAHLERSVATAAEPDPEHRKESQLLRAGGKQAMTLLRLLAVQYGQAVAARQDNNPR